jgi:hypothetical protein
MTRNEFISELKKKLKPNAEMNFYFFDTKKIKYYTVVIEDIGMNVDIDDPKNKNSGGIVFIDKKETKNV